MECVNRLVIGAKGEVWTANSFDIATHCMARGRYELASEFYRIGMESYKRGLIDNPKEKAKARKRARLVYADFQAKLPEFPRLIAVRPGFLSLLARHPGGIDRNTFKPEVGYKGDTAFGVICNQLSRGNWIEQRAVGKSFTLYPLASLPESDEAFLAAYPEPVGLFL